MSKKPTKTLFIPQTAEYGLRAMTQLALLPWEASVSAEHLSRLTSIPKTYLSKVLRKLVEKGLLHAEKGHGGGFKLARPPSTVTFLEVLTAVGYEFSSDRCAFGWERCNSESPCPLHNSFKELEKSFWEWATTTTLSDVNHTVEALNRMNAMRINPSSVKEPQVLRKAAKKSKLKITR